MDVIFITPEDPRWLSCLDTLPHDIYHRPEYMSFASRHEGGSAQAFYAEDEASSCLIPLLVRPLPAALSAPPDWLDATSPYGYPSPLLSATDTAGNHRLVEALISAARDRGLVSVFLRFNPLLDLPEQTLERFGQVRRHGSTVFIDLTKPPDEIWSQTCSMHRRQIIKLQHDGYRAIVDDWQYFDEFIWIYLSTMERVQASSFYFFSDAYFRDMQSSLAEHLHLCTILAPDDRVAAAGLFTLSDRIVQYHLSGSREEYLRDAPTKLMIDTMRRWATAAGASAFHLGGGVGASEDGLYRFKKGFSSDQREFFTCRMIIDQERYRLCLNAWQKAKPRSQSGDYFPLYRSTE